MLTRPYKRESEGLIVELLEPGTARVLSSARVTGPTPQLTDGGKGPVVLSVSGEYVVRVRGFDDRNGRGNYRLMLLRLP